MYLLYQDAEVRDPVPKIKFEQGEETGSWFRIESRVLKRRQAPKTSYLPSRSLHWASSARIRTAAEREGMDEKGEIIIFFFTYYLHPSIGRSALKLERKTRKRRTVVDENRLNLKPKNDAFYHVYLLYEIVIRSI